MADTATQPDRQRTPEEARFIRLIIVCKAFGLTRDDRLDIARHLLARDDITSYNDLYPDEVCRMLDGLEGAVLIAHLMRERPRPVRVCGKCGADVR